MFELKWHRHASPSKVEGTAQDRIRHWQLRFDASPSADFWPVVTISRESGGLGLALGRTIAARLGFTLWDQELVSTLAKTLRIDSAEALALDEHAPSRLQIVLKTLRLSHGAAATDYCEQLRILLASIGRHGSSVIVGRGAHCVILATHALRVRLVAPIDRRVADQARSREISNQLAAREVSARDRDSAQFVRRAFHADVAAAADYDLVINTGTYSPLRAESLVMMAYLAKFGQLPEKARDPSHAHRSGVMSTAPAATGPDPTQRTG